MSATLLLFSMLATTPQPAPERPRCTAKIQSSFWPAAANEDPKLANRLARDGTLEICTMIHWRYRWRSVSVNVSNLGKPPKEKRAQPADGDKPTANRAQNE